MARFAALLTSALLISALGSAASDKAKETVAEYKAAQESSLRSIAAVR